MINKFWMDIWIYVRSYKVDVAEEKVLSLKAANSEDISAKGLLSFNPYQKQNQGETAISFCSNINLG